MKIKIIFMLMLIPVMLMPLSLSMIFLIIGTIILSYIRIVIKVPTNEIDMEIVGILKISLIFKLIGTTYLTMHTPTVNEFNDIKKY